MPRYRKRERKQALLVPVRFEDQIQPGTLEYAIDYLIDNEIDLSGFSPAIGTMRLELRLSIRGFC